MGVKFVSLSDITTAHCSIISFGCQILGQGLNQHERTCVHLAGSCKK